MPTRMGSLSATGVSPGCVGHHFSRFAGGTFTVRMRASPSALRAPIALDHEPRMHACKARRQAARIADSAIVVPAEDAAHAGIGRAVPRDAAGAHAGGAGLGPGPGGGFG